MRGMAWTTVQKHKLAQKDLFWRITATIGEGSKMFRGEGCVGYSEDIPTLGYVDLVMVRLAENNRARFCSQRFPEYRFNDSNNITLKFMSPSTLFLHSKLLRTLAPDTVGCSQCYNKPFGTTAAAKHLSLHYTNEIAYPIIAFNHR